MLASIFAHKKVYILFTLYFIYLQCIAFFSHNQPLDTLCSRFYYTQYPRTGFSSKFEKNYFPTEKRYCTRLQKCTIEHEGDNHPIYR